MYRIFQTFDIPLFFDAAAKMEFVHGYVLPQIKEISRDFITY